MMCVVPIVPHLRVVKYLGVMLLYVADRGLPAVLHATQ